MKNKNNLRPVQEQNIYLIKSIQDQKLIGFSRNDYRLEFNKIDLNCEKQFNWIIQSDDQNEQHYEFRFGEYVLIQNLERNIPINQDKVPLLLQFFNETIDSQVFNKCSNNLIGNQPCILKNSYNNLYLNIINSELTYKQQPFYFQIIPKQNQRNLAIQRPLCNQICDYQIRNYFTGYQLSYSSQFQNDKYLTIKSQPVINLEKWRIFQLESNIYHLYNQAQKCYVQNLSMDKQQESNYIFLSHNQPKNNWRIICPYNQQLSFGTPFLIQDTSNGYYMNIDMFNPKNDESNEFVVVLKKNIETTSLWVVYYMK